MLQGHSTAADNITDARDLALEEDKAGSRAHGTGGVMERCVHGEDERRKKKKKRTSGRGFRYFTHCRTVLHY